MSPDKGPRRHFTHQQTDPCFVHSTYEEDWGGRMERKILKLISKIKKTFRIK